MRVNISGLHRLGVISFSCIHNVTSGLKVQVIRSQQVVLVL